jgi:predicted transcriptional regulator
VWQAAVREKISEFHMTEKDFAKKIGCAQSTMHDLLHSPEARHSSLVAKIHAFFGWQEPRKPEPMPPIFSPEALEMAAVFDVLPEGFRRALLAQAEEAAALIRRK